MRHALPSAVRWPAVVITAFVVCGCAAPRAGVEKPPGTMARTAKPQPTDKISGAVAEAAAAWGELGRRPNDENVRQTYNAAVSRVMSVLHEDKLALWRATVVLPGAEGVERLTYRPSADEGKSAAEYEFIPSDTLPVKSRYFRERSRKAGLGAPVVARARERTQDRNRELAPPQDYYGVTAVLRFQGKTAELAFLDPLEAETVRLQDRSFPLAADFTAPLAMSLRAARPGSLELARLLQPDRYVDTARLIRLQPYDPDKTVVLFIHGLKDTAATWIPMINRLRADATFRRRFQIWVYSYPTGFPYGYSASVLRRQLDEALAQTPLRRPLIVVGHSMGGNIARLLVTDTGEKLWTGIFGRPPAETRMSPRARQILSGTLIFRRRPEVGRVILIAAPLRGSNFAGNIVGRLGSMLVRTPLTLLQVAVDVADLATFRSGELKLRRPPNSIDTLAPNHRYTRAINAIPPDPRVPKHIIVGDRGRGGSREQGNGPLMSDGIVPYWSSHLPDAASEKIIPADHSAHQHPAAIEEVMRILQTNVGR